MAAVAKAVTSRATSIPTIIILRISVPPVRAAFRATLRHVNLYMRGGTDGNTPGRKNFYRLGLESSEIERSSLRAAGEGGELRVLLQPCELRLARGPVAVFAHYYFGDTLVVGV